MRFLVCVTVTFFLAAGGASAQSFDTTDEAWAIAGRNGVTADTWTAVNVASDFAVFVQTEPTPARSTTHWVAFVDADKLDFTLGLFAADCPGKRWRFLQQDTRDWRGGLLSSGGPTDFLFASPGSVGEAVVFNICKYPVIVPGPPVRSPPVTLPIEPTRKEDRVEYTGPRVPS
jgi:hypothetical protein